MGFRVIGKDKGLNWPIDISVFGNLQAIEVLLNPESPKLHPMIANPNFQQERLEPCILKPAAPFATRLTKALGEQSEARKGWA